MLRELFVAVVSGSLSFLLERLFFFSHSALSPSRPRTILLLLIALSAPSCSLSLSSRHTFDAPKTNNNNKMAVCTYCQASFASRNQLFQHLRQQHNLADNANAASSNNNNNPTLTPSQRTQASIYARSTYHNAAHQAYYQAQVAAGVLSAQDWQVASEYFCKPLPVAFRVLQQNNNNKHSSIRYQYWKRLQALVPPNSLQPCPYTTSLAQVAVVNPREWSPAAQQALADCQEVGVTNRQEVCSMIPPLLLLQQEEEQVLTEKNAGFIKILDLCAAPGSKSLQMMDQLAANDGSSAPCTRLLVCNDVNRQRLLTVSRRCRRQPGSTRLGLLLNASDGRFFPTLRKERGGKVKFDAVLADVPCSGDGTLRKLSAPAWENWNVQAHLQLHRLQVRLLARALECVRKGGRVVYSTCSLDPIENEAVLVTAIARQREGPSGYRIVPMPKRLCHDASEPFLYATGATNWVVPHPQFGKKQTDGTEIRYTFDSVDQVPAKLLKKELSPSMFPPRARTETSLREMLEDRSNEDVEKKLGNARFYGEILSDQDIELFQEMLPNCARILPQHLDSGGFFCAIIERLAPEYYAVCYPFLRNVSGTTTTNTEDDYKYHGRILTNVTSSKHLRQLVAHDKRPSDEVVTEGVPTMELALEWLKQHGAYKSGLSEQTIDIPSSEESVDGDGNFHQDEEVQKREKVFPCPRENWTYRYPLYTRLLEPPHPSLVAELCDFWGFSTEPAQAESAGVEVFPANRLVVAGGGDDAFDVETCQDPNLAHRLVERNAALPDDNIKVHRKRRFFQLVLVSDPVWNLFKGGAKFSPTEVGLGLCWVPIPGYYYAGKHPQSSQLDDETNSNKQNEPSVVRFEDVSSRAAHSGRFGVLDDAAEYIGQRATKRVLALTQKQALELLTKFTLDVMGPYDDDALASTDDDASSASWWDRWGKHRLRHTGEWNPGAVIAAVPCGNDDSGCSTLFLPCVLQDRAGQQGRRINLLSEQKLKDVWTRLLKSFISKA